MPIRTTATPSRPYKTPCDGPIQPCPECGGLECLCRPRFFAGQLLTDEDLNRLDHYIVAKNKLHNRYLFGWGVVCGLEVVCHPCNMVAVRPGYALSPCGEDIIVCNETTVDVCALINACRKPQRDPCAPIDASQKNPCEDTIEKWVLAIRYRETPTRGVTSLRGDSGGMCCSRCGGGGSSACGCGGASSTSSGCSCGGAKTSTGSGACSCTSNTATKPRKQPVPQCEPTVLCESYTFEVCQLAPSLANRNQTDFGPLDEAIRCCLTLWKKYMAAPPADQSLAGIQAWCCSVRDGLAELFAAHPGHTCTLAEQIGLMCADPGPNADPKVHLAQILTQVGQLLAKFLHDCFCSALLPPCPSPVDDDRIFLATITVRRKDCKILEICNWDQRHFVVTFPMLRYWLSPLPFAKNLKKAITNLCCQPAAVLNQQINERAFTTVNAKAANQMNGARAPLNEEEFSADLGTIFAHAMLNPNRSVSPATLALASLGATDPNNQPLLTPEEMANPGETVLIHQLIRPMLRSGLVPQLAGIAGAVGSADVDALRTEISGLRATLATQQQSINDLRARLG